MGKSAEDVLKTAILLERRGKAFYTTAARETESEAARKIFMPMKPPTPMKKICTRC